MISSIMCQQGYWTEMSTVCKVKVSSMERADLSMGNKSRGNPRLSAARQRESPHDSALRRRRALERPTRLSVSRTLYHPPFNPSPRVLRLQCHAGSAPAQSLIRVSMTWSWRVTGQHPSRGAFTVTGDSETTPFEVRRDKSPAASWSRWRLLPPRRLFVSLSNWIS